MHCVKNGERFFDSSFLYYYKFDGFIKLEQFQIHTTLHTYLCRRLPTAKAQPTTITEEEIAINMIKVIGDGFEDKKEIAKNIQNGFYICRKLKLIHDHFTVVCSLHIIVQSLLQHSKLCHIILDLPQLLQRTYWLRAQPRKLL